MRRFLESVLRPLPCRRCIIEFQAVRFSQNLQILLLGCFGYPPVCFACLVRQVSKEAVATLSRMARSVELALLSPPARAPFTRRRTLSLEDGEWTSVAPPQNLSSRGGSESDYNNRWEDIDDVSSARSTSNSSNGSGSGSFSSTTGAGLPTNNWSSTVPLPRLALLSGLTTMRLAVSLAGVRARVPAKGLIDHSGRTGANFNGAAAMPSSASATASVSTATATGASPPPKTALSGPDNLRERARMVRARRCIRRVARQLVERIHPAATSAGYRQACRLFRDEMVALGFDHASVTEVLKALLEMTAKLRDPDTVLGDAERVEQEDDQSNFVEKTDEHEEKKGEEEDEESPFWISPPPTGTPSAAAADGRTAPGRAAALGAAANRMPDAAIDGAIPGERDDARELEEAGMAVLLDRARPSPQSAAVVDEDDAGDGVDEGESLLDIATVEVGRLEKLFGGSVQKRRRPCAPPQAVTTH